MAQTQTVLTYSELDIVLVTGAYLLSSAIFHHQSEDKMLVIQISLKYFSYERQFVENVQFLQLVQKLLKNEFGYQYVQMFIFF